MIVRHSISPSGFRQSISRKHDFFDGEDQTLMRKFLEIEQKRNFYSVVSTPAAAQTGHSLVYAVPSKAIATNPSTGEATAGNVNRPDTRFRL